MNRRGFFRRTVGAIVAAVSTPKVFQLPVGERLVMRGTYGNIQRATFTFWRDQVPVGQSVQPSAELVAALRRSFEACTR